MRNRNELRDPELASPIKEDAALRCCCGSLLARVVAEGVELKCRRCKRQVVVSLRTKAGVRINM